MNPTFSFLQKHGLKVSLPLLLLATACGDGGGNTAFRPNGGSAAGQAITNAAKPDTSAFGVPKAPSTGLGTPNVTLPDNTNNSSSGPVLPPTNAGGGAITGGTGNNSGAGAGAGATASVPEPAALAGLAIAAAGMVVIKRKQSAA